MKDAFEEILRQYWGYDSFRSIQRDIIESIASGHDTLGLMPTGGGKSITFQVPALCQEGTCLVITPLIALMKDQVARLRTLGIKATAIHTGMDHRLVLQALENCILGDYKLLYISPERISSQIFRDKLAHMRISFICVDEAHCISQWGYDFRPSYLTIHELRRMVPNVPILALTATATPSVVKDIQRQLHFHDGRVFRMSFERPNLSYIVERHYEPESRIMQLAANTEGTIIIYCHNRQRCIDMARRLTENGESATYYHAGLSDSEKDQRQRDWQSNKTRIIVCTNAFGMGIDKPDVRAVLHLGIPDSIEAYFQEAGRAGRDGLPSQCILVCNEHASNLLAQRVQQSYPPKEYVAKVYEDMCCFLQLAVGDGIGIRREFNIGTFCQTFRHFPLMAESALKLLTQAGYVRYEDADEGVSRVHIIMSRNELYQLQLYEPHDDRILQQLMRQYTGLFSDYTIIDETSIARNTGLTASQIYDILKRLSQQRIIHYIPRKNIPHVSFPQSRVPTSDIFLPRSIYEDLRDAMQERIDAMRQYIEEHTVCRSRYLVHYFGEDSKHNCGTCDVCMELAQTAPEQPSTELQKRIHDDILQQITQAGHLHPFYLKSDDYETEVFQHVLRQMVDEREIITDDNLCLHKA